MNEPTRFESSARPIAGADNRWPSTDSADLWRVIVCCDGSRRFDPKMVTALRSTINLSKRQAYRLMIAIARNSGELCIADDMTQAQSVKAVEALSIGKFEVRCEAAEYPASVKVATASTLAGALKFRLSGSQDTN